MRGWVIAVSETRGGVVRVEVLQKLQEAVQIISKEPAETHGGADRESAFQEEVVKAVRIIAQEIVDVPSLQVQQQVVEAAKVSPQETMQKRTEGQIVKVPLFSF